MSMLLPLLARGTTTVMDINQLIQLITEALTASPQQPNGELAGGGRPMGPPAGTDTPDPMAAQLMQMLQMLQLAQQHSPQQGMNALQGQQGAMYGAMGGRPVGS